MWRCLSVLTVCTSVAVVEVVAFVTAINTRTLAFYCDTFNGWHGLGSEHMYNKIATNALNNFEQTFQFY